MGSGTNGAELRGAEGWDAMEALRTRGTPDRVGRIGPRDEAPSGPRPLTATALDDVGVRAANQEIIVDPEVNRMITRYGWVALLVMLGFGGVIGTYGKLHGFNDSPRAPREEFTLTDPDAHRRITCLREAVFDAVTNTFARNRWAAENCDPAMMERVGRNRDAILEERDRILMEAAGIPKGSIRWQVDAREGTMHTEVDSTGLFEAYRKGKIR